MTPTLPVPPPPDDTESLVLPHAASTRVAQAAAAAARTARDAIRVFRTFLPAI